jgi:hypothetical protein
MIKLTNNRFDPKVSWENPILKYKTPDIDCVDLFDTNGYDLTNLEQDYAEVNTPYTYHRYKRALKYTWFEMKEPVIEGVHINHALLFERKAYTGDALEQLKSWSSSLPLVNKLTKIRSKWGIDLSIDYVDREGNVFEVFHYEWDDFCYDNVMVAKEKIEKLALTTDWNDAAKELLKRRDEWASLPFFEQSDWKCRFYGIEPEKFKIIIWND